MNRTERTGDSYPGARAGTGTAKNQRAKPVCQQALFDTCSLTFAARRRFSLTCFWWKSLSGGRLKVGEFKKSTAELKEAVIPVGAMLNKHGRVVETERPAFEEGKNRKI